MHKGSYRQVHWTFSSGLPFLIKNEKKDKVANYFQFLWKFLKLFLHCKSHEQSQMGRTKLIFSVKIAIDGNIQTGS